jgi:hypothetical protein
MKLKNEEFEYPVFILGMMLFLGAMFFLSTGLVQPFQDMVRYINDPHASRSWSEWGLFTGLSIVAGGLWTACYLGFKVCEQLFLKKFLEKKTKV